jgi:hypothetical protein
MPCSPLGAYSVSRASLQSFSTVSCTRVWGITHPIDPWPLSGVGMSSGQIVQGSFPWTLTHESLEVVEIGHVIYGLFPC